MKIYKVLQSLFLFCMLLAGFTSCSEPVKKNKTEAPGNDSPKTVTSYDLAVPDGWTTERIFFPIDFAPNISYTGVEDLRFTKGWGEPFGDEHWCYAFLWWLDGKPLIDAASLQSNLTDYYSGLVKRNIQQRSIPAVKVVPTVAAIKKTATAAGDTGTYNGTINMLDYLSGDPIVLNCLIHIKNCADKDHTAILFEVSPKPYDDAMWQQLNKLVADFKCGNQ